MSSDKPVLEPLSLKLEEHGAATEGATEGATALDNTIRCMFCNSWYDEPSERDLLLKHLLEVHKLVISDVKLIAHFPKYLDYWRKRFSEQPVANFCSLIKTNSKHSDPEQSELYYLLCDVLPEDKELRIKLQRQKLDTVLAQQQEERQDSNFSKKCLFCKLHFTENRAELFDHMVLEHNFSVGKSDNLVYTNELIGLLDKTLHDLQCLYCERTFKDRHVLKEHMRKKQHKKINPNNDKYDKFYVINYLELGKNWESVQAEPEPQDPGDDSDTSSLVDEWSDWTEEGAQAVCLYCQMTSTDINKVIQHMKEIHLFDLCQWKEELNLTFYQQVKLINYIRRQMHQCTCPKCEETFESSSSLLDHMNYLGHVSQIPDTTTWDQPQYFFPTYENDALLCGLDDGDELGNCDNSDKRDLSASSVVVAEECPIRDSILTQKELREELLS